MIRVFVSDECQIRYVMLPMMMILISDFEYVSECARVLGYSSKCNTMSLPSAFLHFVDWACSGQNYSMRKLDNYVQVTGLAMMAFSICTIHGN